MNRQNLNYGQNKEVKDIKRESITRIQALPPLDQTYEEDDTNKLLADFGNIQGIKDGYNPNLQIKNQSKSEFQINKSKEKYEFFKISRIK